MKADVVASVDHRGAMLAIIAEHGSENVNGGQNAASPAMGEGDPVTLIVPEVAIDELAFEYIANEAAAIAATSLHNDVAQAKIVEVATLSLAGDRDAMTIASGTTDFQPFDQNEASGRIADQFHHTGAIVDGRYQARPMRNDAAEPRNVGTRRNPQRPADPVFARRDGQHAGGLIEQSRIESTLQRMRIVRPAISDDTEIPGRKLSAYRPVFPPPRRRMSRGKHPTERQAAAE
jgi:hypothetical protein